MGSDGAERPPGPTATTRKRAPWSGVRPVTKPETGPSPSSASAVPTSLQAAPWLSWMMNPVSSSELSNQRNLIRLRLSKTFCDSAVGAMGTPSGEVVTESAGDQDDVSPPATDLISNW